MSTLALDTSRAVDPSPVVRKKPTTPGRRLLHAFLIVVAVTWLFPLLWALYNSFRNYSYTAIHGYASFGGFTVSNFTNAWKQGSAGEQRQPGGGSVPEKVAAGDCGTLFHRR